MYYKALGSPAGTVLAGTASHATWNFTVCRFVCLGNSPRVTRGTAAVCLFVEWKGELWKFQQKFFWVVIDQVNASLLLKIILASEVARKSRSHRNRSLTVISLNAVNFFFFLQGDVLPTTWPPPRGSSRTEINPARMFARWIDDDVAECPLLSIAGIEMCVTHSGQIEGFRRRTRRHVAW